MHPLPNQTCPLCGGANDCAPADCGSFDVDCWCSKTTINPQALARIPEEQRNQACLCRQCASLPSTELNDPPTAQT